MSCWHESFCMGVFVLDDNYQNYSTLNPLVNVMWQFGVGIYVKNIWHVARDNHVLLFHHSSIICNRFTAGLERRVDFEWCSRFFFFCLCFLIVSIFCEFFFQKTTWLFVQSPLLTKPWSILISWGMATKFLLHCWEGRVVDVLGLALCCTLLSHNNESWQKLTERPFLMVTSRTS